MQLPLAYLDRAAIEEVSIDLWIDVFDAVGWPSSLAGKRDVLAYDDIVSGLSNDELSDPLLQALEALHSFILKKAITSGPHAHPRGDEVPWG